MITFQEVWGLFAYSLLNGGPFAKLVKNAFYLADIF